MNINKETDLDDADTTHEVKSEEGLKHNDDLVCQPCKDDGKTLPAEGFCVTCEEHLCEHCLKHHSVPRLYRHHVLQDKNEMPTVLRTKQNSCKPSHMCPIHNIFIESFCTPHKALCCTRCVALSHQLCEKRHIQDIDIEYEHVESSDEFKTYLTKLRALHAGYDKTRSTALQNMKEIDMYHKQAMSVFKQLIDKIRETDEENVVQIIDVCDKVLLQLNDLMQRDIRNDVYNNRDLFIKMSSFEGHAHFINTNLESLNKRNEFQRFCFRPLDSRTLYGSLWRVSVSKDTLCHGKNMCYQVFLVPNNHLFVVGSESIVCIDYNDKKQVENYDLDRFGTVSVKYVGKTVLIIKSRPTGNTVQSAAVAGFQIAFESPRPTGNTVQSAAVAGLQIAFESPSIKIGKMSLFGLSAQSNLNDYRVVITKKAYSPIIYNGNTLFAFCRDELGGITVDELDNNGNLKRSICADLVTKNANGNEYIKQPASAVYDAKDDVIFVTDFLMNSVFKMTTEGDCHCIVASERLASPADIAICHDGTLMVCCTKSKSIVKVTKDGQILTFIGPLEFEPYSLAYDGANSALYVGGKCQNIHVFLA